MRACLYGYHRKGEKMPKDNIFDALAQEEERWDGEDLLESETQNEEEIPIEKPMVDQSFEEFDEMSDREKERLWRQTQAAAQINGKEHYDYRDRQIKSYLEQALEIENSDPKYRERLLKMIINLGLSQDDPLLLVLIATGHLRTLMEDLPKRQQLMVNKLSEDLDRYRRELDQVLEEKEKKFTSLSYYQAKAGTTQVINEHKEKLEQSEREALSRLAHASSHCQMLIIYSYNQVIQDWEKKVKEINEEASLIKRADSMVIVTGILILLIFGLLSGLGITYLLENSDKKANQNQISAGF